jgi:hypothetical protein
MQDRIRHSYSFATVGVGIVLFVSPLLMLLFATGPVGSDDTDYLRGASEILHSGWVPELHHHLGRKVFILIAGIPAALTGYVMVGGLVNIACSTLLNVVVAIFAYRQFSFVPALVAAIVTGLNGVTLVWSGTLLPDTTLSLFMFLSVMTLYYAILPSSESRLGLLALAGALGALAYAIKEPAALLGPPGVASILLLQRHLRLPAQVLRSMVYAGAFASGLLVDSLLQLVLSGDFLYRTHAITEIHNQSVPAVPPGEFIREVYWSIATIIFQYPNTLLLPALAAIICWPVAACRRSPTSVFAITGLFVGGYLIFGTTSFPDLRPLPFEPRYLAPLFPLLGVSLAETLARNESPSRVISIGWSAASLVYVAASVIGAADEAGNLVRARYFKNVAAAVEEIFAQNPDAPVMAERNTLEVLTQFLPRAEAIKLKLIPSDDNLPPGYYLMDPLVPGRHSEQIKSLPIVATVNLDPLVMSRYFPDFGSEQFKFDTLTGAVVREKR